MHQGSSPAYTKIRNDTFRTLATNPLFRQRVSENSLARVLNAVAWKLHDAHEARINGWMSPPTMSVQSAATASSLDAVPVSPTTIPREPSLADGTTMTTTTAATTMTTTTTTSTHGGSSSQFPAHHQHSRSSLTTGTNDSGGAVGASEYVGYVQGMNVLAAPFLYVARSEAEAFAAFDQLIRSEVPGYVRGSMEGVHRGLALVDEVLHICDPKLFAWLAGKGLNAAIYAFPSVLTLCACTPPLPEVLVLWDFLFAYGAHLNLLCIVAQLVLIRDQILESDRYVFSLSAFVSSNRPRHERCFAGVWQKCALMAADVGPVPTRSSAPCHPSRLTRSKPSPSAS